MRLSVKSKRGLVPGRLGAFILALAAAPFSTSIIYGHEFGQRVRTVPILKGSELPPAEADGRHFPCVLARDLRRSRIPAAGLRWQPANGWSSKEACRSAERPRQKKMPALFQIAPPIARLRFGPPPHWLFRMVRVFRFASSEFPTSCPHKVFRPQHLTDRQGSRPASNARQLPACRRLTAKQKRPMAIWEHPYSYRRSLSHSEQVSWLRSRRSLI